MPNDLNSILKNISSNLKILRKNHKYSQTQVSIYLDMERRGYQKIEYNEIKDLKLSTLYKILRFYKITFEELIK